MTRNVFRDDSKLTDAAQPVFPTNLESRGGEAVEPALPVEPWYKPDSVVLRREPPKVGCVEFTFTMDAALARPNRKVLADFAGLARDLPEKTGWVIGNPDKLASFANRYGPLGLCKSHGRPVTHWRPGTQAAKGNFCPLDIKRGDGVTVVRETWVAWNYYSRVAQAVIQQLDERADQADREAISNFVFVFNRSQTDSARDAILTWLQACQIRLWLDPERPRLSIYTVPSLFGYIGVQLALLAANRGALAICANCGEGFTPKRLPAGDRRAYCLKPGCRKARWRHAQRDKRARARAKTSNSRPAERKR